MRKITTLFLIALFFFMWSGGTILAGDYSVTWWRIQKRNYEDGRTFNRLQFGLKDSNGNDVTNNVVKTVTLLGPSGPIPLPEGPPDFFYNEVLNGSYNADSAQWNYDSNFDFKNQFMINFSNGIEIGNYTLKVVDVDDAIMTFASGISSTQYFNGIVDLPKITSKSFRGYEDASGNLLWYWDLPMDTYFWASSPDVSCACWVTIMNGDTYVGDIWVRLPVTMGMMFVPSSVMNKAKLKGDNLKLGILLRTNDDNNRYYANEIPLTSLKKKRTNIVVVPL
jgi:hypothetical protein